MEYLACKCEGLFNYKACAFRRKGQKEEKGPAGNDLSFSRRRNDYYKKLSGNKMKIFN